MPGRLSAADKARQMLTEGRVVILAVDRRYVRAQVRSSDSGAIYIVEHVDGFWLCPCECRTICSHVKAVQLVTAPVRLAVAPARPGVVR